MVEYAKPASRGTQKAQATLEALVCAAALAGFLCVLVAASSDAARDSGVLSESLNSRTQAELLAFNLNIHAADARLTSYSKVDLEDCFLLEQGVKCGNSTAKTMMQNSGGERYGFFKSLPN